MTTAHIPAADGSRSSTQYTPDVSRAPTGSAGADGARRPRIAVIAVHGVGNHNAGETGDAVSALLRGHATGRATGEQYVGFGSEPIAIPLNRLKVPLVTQATEQGADPPGQMGDGVKLARRVRERSGFFEAVRGNRERAIDNAPIPARRDHPSAEPPLATRISYEFYRTQLAAYDPGAKSRQHHSTRWRGRRAAGDSGAPEADVDVYEMYWADLSKLRSGTLAFFRAFYQLLLHIPTLGRQAIDAAIVEQPGGEWHWLQNAYTLAIRCLLIGVPVLSAVLLVAGVASLPATFLPRHLGETGSAAVAIAVVAVAGLALVYRSLQHRHVSRSALRWSFIPVAAALGSIALGAALAGLVPFPGVSPVLLVRTCLTIEWWTAATLAAYVGFAAYDRRRPGARGFARIAFAIAIGCFVTHTIVAFPASGVSTAVAADFERAYQTASLWTVEVTYAAFAFLWDTIYLSMFVAFACAARCWWRNRDHRSLEEPERAKRARARAVLRTMRLTASLAVAGFLLTAITTVGAVYQTLVKRADLFVGLPATQSPLLRALPSILQILAPSPTQVSTWLPGLIPQGPDHKQVETLLAHQYITGLFAGSTTIALPIVLALLAACALVLLWTALPSVGFEVKSPSTCTNQNAEDGGNWLLRGLDATAYVSWMMWIAMYVVVPVGSVMGAYELLHSQRANSVLQAATLALLDTTGALLATSAIAAAVLLAKYGGTALDVVLDVDNYLRGYPDDETPTAQIAERYASLLRHVAAAQEAGRGYDAVVIVAHSLGTTITTDVLRTLHLQAGSAFGDPALAPFGYGPDGAPAQVPIHFFSMGCPLRQLMNRFFPHRFWWVRDFPDGGVARPKMQFDKIGAATPPIRPDPRALGVAGWSNAYRTGDYVGRSLWLDRWFRRTTGKDVKDGSYPEQIATLDDAPANVPRWEACIGLGAHTHYWDASAPDVADHLDTLIERAVLAAAARRAA